MNTQLLSLYTGIVGVMGIMALLFLTGMILWYYRDSRMGSFRWRWRNLRLKQLAALACLFCLAMTASYAVLQEAWTFVYLIAAIKTGTWWFRIALSQRI